MKASGQGSGNGSKTELTGEDMQKLGNIFGTHVKYKKCLESCSEIKDELNEFKQHLTSIKSSFDKARTNLNGSKTDIPAITIIDSSLFYLKYVKIFISNKLDNSKECVEKLEEIGTHITTMKDSLGQVKSKVEDKAKSYIQGLADIDIKQSEVQENIKNIQNMNKSVIARLQIAKHTIEFYRSIETEVEKLNGVEFKKQDISEIINNHEQIKGKVTSFGSQIKSKLCKAMEEIEKFKGQVKEAAKNGDNCAGKTKVEQDDGDPVSKVEKCINDSVKEIKSFIDNSLNVINVIKYLLQKLENNKNQSVTYLDDIKSNVSGIKGLNDATKSIKVFYMFCII